jgi:hypothetical protein
VPGSGLTALSAPTTIIVAGLALAGYALLMTALDRRMGVPLLAVVGVLGILLLVEVVIIAARLAGGERPAGLATLIGYLIATPLVPAPRPGRRRARWPGSTGLAPGNRRLRQR